MTRSIKILINEHDLNDIELLQYELRNGDFEYNSKIVQTRHDFESSLNTFKPDIIISDFLMPSFGGEVALEIRQNICPDIPFIFVSGIVGEENAVELIKNGATDFVLKEKLFQINPKILRALAEANERKEKVDAELQLQKSKEQLQKIMDLSLDIICSIDREGKFVSVGAASKNILGYLPSELQGKSISKLVYKEDLEHTLKITSAIVTEGIEVTDFENRYICKNGNIVPLIWSARWDTTEELMYCVGRDASKIKAAEEALKSFANDLQRSNEELEQFAFITSHDLQEPLRTIVSFLTLLENKYASQLDVKARQYIRYAVDGATRMRTIILDLLEYSRLGQKDEQIEETDLNKLLEIVVHLCQATIEEKGAIIEWNNLPVIRAGKTSLLLIWQNLLGNALKYQKPGVTPIIKIDSTEYDTYWQFSITDNGIGIQQQFFQKIFVVFQRLHNMNEFTGTGIGLAICKRIVENHKGDIWVASIPGQGSTFYFTISKQL